MTTDDLQQGLPAARKLRSWMLTPLLLCAAIPAFAQETPAPAVALTALTTASVDMTVDPAAAPAPTSAAAPRAASTGVRDRAADAASATLAALLPHLAANDTIPLLDRSAMFAGDLSRLLANYDLQRAGTNAEDGKIQSVLKRALSLLGTPYRWGGTDPDSGLDCSGLVGYVFRTSLGIELPRVSRDMAAETGQLIKDRAQLTPGDLVFFGRGGAVNHVGIYVGEGRFLHSPSTGKDVRVDSLLVGYWGEKFLQARRVAM